MNALWHAFAHFAHTDHANAAIHTAPVRYSPITFRLMEQLEGAPGEADSPPSVILALLWSEVYYDKQAKAYEEDKGR